tara:strand:+ start:3064 stop:3315 length:252 start_codon:yes stop_codon:yes gene_type:complete
MKEPTRYSMSTGEPAKEETTHIPLPSLSSETQKYPEPMTNDTFSQKDLQQENSFFNFIQKAKDSKKKYEEKLEKISKEAKESS